MHRQNVRLVDAVRMFETMLETSIIIKKNAIFNEGNPVVLPLVVSSNRASFFMAAVFVALALVHYLLLLSSSLLLLLVVNTIVSSQCNQIHTRQYVQPFAYSRR